MAQDTGDPFAFLRALAPAPGGDPADSVGGAAPATEAELFAGSEPVPAETVPAVAVPVPDTAPAPASDPAGAVASGGAATVALAADESAIMRAALVQLDTRLQAIELIAKQNGWSI